LNNFDFSSRSQQKEGLTDEMIILKEGMDVLFVPKKGRKFERGTIVGFELIKSEEEEEMIKNECLSLKLVQSSAKEWISKHSRLPKVRFDNGKTKTIQFRTFVVHSMRKAVAWRVQLPLRPAYAISLYKSYQMVLHSISV
jgi:hypothetical protein